MSEAEHKAVPPCGAAKLGRTALHLFESLLWGSRWLSVIAVVTSLALWLLMLFITTVDAYYLARLAADYVNPALDVEARTALRSRTISSVIGIVDGYLIASALFIFTLGLYRQFVSRLEVAEGSEVGNRLLDVDTFDDLKDRLAKVIVLILIVKFLQQALALTYDSMSELLVLALCAVLIGGAVYLSRDHGQK